MQLTDLTENSKYLLSVFWHPSVLIKMSKQVQSTQDLGSQNTQRCDCRFFSAQFFSLFQENTWGLLAGVSYAAFRCLDKLSLCFLPTGNPNRWGCLWSPSGSEHLPLLLAEFEQGELMAPYGCDRYPVQGQLNWHYCMKGSLFRIMKHSTGLTA